MNKPSRSEEQEPLSQERFAYFKKLLAARRAKILLEAEEQFDAVRKESDLRMSDEVDMASVEYDQAFEHRMRDRDKGLLKKIEKALARLDEGRYDECESCGNYIGFKRLSARPEATLCIECKEEQERVESKFKKARDTETQFPFK